MSNQDKNNEKIPKVFISYSWTSEEHRNNVIELAYQLMSDHIEVVIDEWDLPEGNDLNFFMEENVRSSEIDYVLIISDKEYAEKANSRIGGVGTETQIISKQVYENVKQTKFIPILWEKYDDGTPCLPDYLATRKYIDLTPKNRYKEYTKLLRRIHNLPENPKPKIGEFPKELLETNTHYPKLKEMIETLGQKIENNPTIINALTSDFLKQFFKNLQEFQIKFKTRENKEIASELHENIESYTPLRDYFIEFFEKIIKTNSYTTLDYTIITEFFEKLFNSFTTPKIGQEYTNEDFMNFDFIIRELFLYLITISLVNHDYELVSDLLNAPYYFKDIYQGSQDSQTFVSLDRRSRIRTDYYLTLYCNENELNKLTGMGHFLTTRIHSNYEIDDLVNSDILCCHISIITFKDRGDWFPYTYIYKSSESFPLYRKLTSKNHFEKVKCIFDVETIQELQEKIKSSDEYFGVARYGFRNIFFNYVKPITNYVNIENIATKR